MTNGIHDHDPPGGRMALYYSSASFTALGLLYVLLAVCAECLKLLHAATGGFLLLSGIGVATLTLRATARR